MDMGVASNIITPNNSLTDFYPPTLAPVHCVDLVLVCKGRILPPEDTKVIHSMDDKSTSWAFRSPVTIEPTWEKNIY